MVLAEDRLLELPQRWTGLDPELLDERGPGPAVGLERLRLPSRPVERAHDQLTGTLPERVGVNEPLGLRERVGVPAAGEVGLERALEHQQAHLLEPRRFVLEERLIGEVGESGPAPQRERLAQHAGGLLEAPVVQRDAAGSRQPLEDVQVERVGLDACHVAGASCLDRIAAERLAKLRDRPLDEVRRAGRRLVAPHGVDDPRGRHQAAGLGEQNHQHASLARPAQLDRAPVDERLHRSEQLIPHGRPTMPASRRRLPPADLRHRHRLRDSLQLKLAGRAHRLIDSRPRHVADDLRDEDLAGPGGVTEPARNDHGSPVEVFVVRKRLTRVQADPQPEVSRRGGHGALHVDRATHGRDDAWERHHQAVAGRLRPRGPRAPRRPGAEPRTARAAARPPHRLPRDRRATSSPPGR